MSGILVDIEGLDGSGKETQAKLLYEYIRSNISNKANYISFPDYNSKSSELVKMYLNGEFGHSPLDVNAYAASSFFAVDRFHSYKKVWEKAYNSGEWIIANRYTSSNFLYQLPKLKKTEWENYLNWAADYEYNKLGLPKPDAVFYLYVPVEISQKLMEKRYNGDSSKKDLHEADINFLKFCEEAARYAAERNKWNVIKCVEGGKLKSVEEIHKEIILCIKNNINYIEI